MSATLCAALLVLGALDNVAGRVKSTILNDFNIIGLIVDSLFKLVVVGVLVAQERKTLANEGQFEFFLKRNLRLDLDTEDHSKPLGSRGFTFRSKHHHCIQWQVERSSLLLVDALRERLVNRERDRDSDAGLECPLDGLSVEELASSFSDGGFFVPDSIDVLPPRSSRRSSADRGSEPSVPETPIFCCLEFALRTLASDLWNMAKRIVSTAALSFKWFSAWAATWPNAKFLILIAALETLSFSCLLYTQSRVPGPIAVNTDLVLLPWTALMARWILRRPLTGLQILSIATILYGSYLATNPSVDFPIQALTPVPHRPLPTDALTEPHSSALNIYIAIRVLAFLPLSLALIVREGLLEKYRLFSQLMSNPANLPASRQLYALRTIRLLNGSSCNSFPQGSIVAAEPSEKTLSVTLLFFGTTAAQVVFSPLAISIVLWVSASDAFSNESLAALWAAGAGCLAGDASKNPACSMAPMAYSSYLTVSLAFNLTALACLKNQSAMNMLSAAQLIAPLTTFMYQFMPLPILTSADRRISAALWIGTSLIFLGQCLYWKSTPLQTTKGSYSMTPHELNASSEARSSSQFLLRERSGGDSQTFFSLFKKSPSQTAESPACTLNSPFYPQSTDDWGDNSTGGFEPATTPYRLLLNETDI